MFKRAAELIQYLGEASLMDNSFMNLCFNNNISCVQAVIRIIMGRDDLRVIHTQTQKNYQGFKRSLTIDVYAEDDNGTLYDIEIQKTNEGASPKRARFHSAMIDVHSLEKGQKFDELPESCVIFITQNDVLKQNKAMYTIHKYIDGTNERFNDGQHIIYVNCSAENDGSEIWKLIHDMSCTDSNEMLVPELAERTGFFKNIKKGDSDMGTLDEYIDSIINEAVEIAIMKTSAETKERSARNIALKLIAADKLTLEEIASCTGLPIAEIKALAHSPQA